MLGCKAREGSEEREMRERKPVPSERLHSLSLSYSQHDGGLLSSFSKARPLACPVGVGPFPRRPVTRSCLMLEAAFLPSIQRLACSASLQKEYRRENLCSGGRERRKKHRGRKESVRRKREGSVENGTVVRL